MALLTRSAHTAVRLIALLGLLLLAGACGLKKEAVFTGRTMGTVYRVKVVTGYFQKTAHLEKAVDNRLAEINASMSIYQADSEISRFNTHGATTPFPISTDFASVVTVGARLHEQTDGAWDATVSPLINLWGFGTKQQLKALPPAEEIKRLLEDTGFEKLKITAQPALIKQISTLSLNLGSIAKGFGVDQIARLIEADGIDNYLVEIGGEVSAAGRRKDGKNWRIGINTPEKESAFGDVYKVITLHNKTMATSGDYRNYFEIDGNVYSHVLDPRTGYPVTNGVVSVSIIADSCTYADGLATAVMVMGRKAGMDLIRRLPNVEGMIVVRQPDGKLVDYYSEGFRVEAQE